MMQRFDTLVADALWETIHAEVQDFVQNTLATMLRTTFRKKKDLSRWGFQISACSLFKLLSLLLEFCQEIKFEIDEHDGSEVIEVFGKKLLI